MQTNRRNVLTSLLGAGLLGAATGRGRAQQSTAPPWGMPAPRIQDIRVIECQPAGARLSVVKITANQDGLYGYGCATFTQRADLVKPAVEKCPKPLPGWGIEIDEKAAAKFPFGSETGPRKNRNGGWDDLRLPHGTVIKQ